MIHYFYLIGEAPADTIKEYRFGARMVLTDYLILSYHPSIITDHKAWELFHSWLAPAGTCHPITVPQTRPEQMIFNSPRKNLLRHQGSEVIS
jgi:hypothetical protein